MKKKVLLSYVYSSKNAGDLAICIGAIDLLIKAGFEVILLSKYDKSDSEFYSSESYYKNRYGDNIIFLEAPFTLNREGNKLSQIINNLKGGLVYLGLGNTRSKLIEKYIKDSDYIIFNGGNLLRCSSFIDYARLLALHYPIKKGNIFGKNYLIFPQSSAEITGYGTGLLKSFIGEAKKVFIREMHSYKKLKNEFNFNNLVPTIDLAYFINKDNLIENTKKDNTIAITLRAHSIGDINEFDDLEKDKIYKSLYKFLEQKEYNNFNIVFVVQTKKDLVFTEFILDRFKKDLPYLSFEIFESYDPKELLDFYKNIRLLVGMRLHSIILASSIGVPCYGLFYKEWGLKNPGLMDSLEMPYTMMDDNGVIDTKNGINFLLNNGDILSNKLKSKVKLEEDKIIKILHEEISK